MTNCDGVAYATAEDYVGFLCNSARISRVHDGPDEALSLTDSIGRFRTRGIQAGVGMILYNLTDGSQAVVTGVTEDNLVGTLTGGVDNFWEIGDQYLIVTVDAFERATVDHYLEVTASDIAAAVAAGGQCECSITAWGAALLKKLNILDAISLYVCSCRAGAISDTERQQHRNFVEAQLKLIREGRIDVCGGSGSDGPAFGSSKEAVTPFAAAQIIRDRIERGRGV